MTASLTSIGDAGFLARLRERSSRDAAFEELVHGLREQLFAVGLHITGSAADADDAIQETFLAVHLGLEDFRGEASVSTWVHRIAIRAALRVRARKRSTIEVDKEQPAPCAADALVAAEFSQRVAGAMQRLSAEHRIVLSLFAVDGLSHAQIADILGLPQGTVWSRLHTARKRLAAELGI